MQYLLLMMSRMSSRYIYVLIWHGATRTATSVARPHLTRYVLATTVHLQLHTLNLLETQTRLYWMHWRAFKMYSSVLTRDSPSKCKITRNQQFIGLSGTARIKQPKIQILSCVRRVIVTSPNQVPSCYVKAWDEERSFLQSEGFQFIPGSGPKPHEWCIGVTLHGFECWWLSPIFWDLRDTRGCREAVWLRWPWPT